MGKKLDLTLALLNGAIGDHLARTGNGLATEMTLRSGGHELPLQRGSPVQRRDAQTVGGTMSPRVSR